MINELAGNDISFSSYVMGMRLGIWQIDPFLFILLSEVLKFFKWPGGVFRYLFICPFKFTPTMDIMCDKSQCPFTIPYSTYRMIDQTELCECFLDSGIFTLRNSSCRKVIISQACVKNSVHGGGMVYTHP